MWCRSDKGEIRVRLTQDTTQVPDKDNLPLLHLSPPPLVFITKFLYKNCVLMLMYILQFFSLLYMSLNISSLNYFCYQHVKNTLLNLSLKVKRPGFACLAGYCGAHCCRQDGCSIASQPLTNYSFTQKKKKPVTEEDQTNRRIIHPCR